MKKRIVCVLLTLMLLMSLVPAGALSASAAEMTVSDSGLRVIKEFEGYSSKCQWDYSQWTTGYGTKCEETHTISNPNVGDLGGHTITEAKASEALAEELAAAEKAVNDFASKNSLSLSQSKFDALVSFTYNCGSGWTSGNSVFNQAVVKGLTGNSFLNAIIQWATAGGEIHNGLMKRRMAEANMYLNGVYSETPPTNYTYVVYDGNGGEASQKNQAYNTNTSVLPAATATKEGYTFKGWYTAATGGAWIDVLDGTAGTKAAKLYAHWQAATNPAPTEASYTLTASQLVNKNVYKDLKGTAWPEQTTAMASKTSFTIVEDYIDASGNRWARISGSGWVKVGTPEVKEEESVTTPTTLVVTVTNTYINVRQEAKTTSKQLGTVNQGDKLTISKVTTASNGTKWGCFTNDKYTNAWVALMYTDYDSVKNQTGSSSSDSSTSVDTNAIASALVVCGTKVNVRNGAGMNNKVIGSLSNGTTVNIYEIKTVSGHKWGRTSDGWFCLDYAQLTYATENGGTTTTDPNAEKPIYTGLVVVGTSLNVREAAGVSKKQVGSIANGTTINIYETTTVNGHKWGRTDGGWVCLDYVTLTAVSGGTTTDKDNTTTTTPAVTGYTGKVSGVSTALVVRKGAGYDSEATDVSYKNGDKITVTSLVEGKNQANTDCDWGKVEGGYVCMDYVTLDAINYTVNTNNLNVRATAGDTTGTPVDTLSKGAAFVADDLTVVGTRLWAHSTKFGGWVNTLYLDLDVASDVGNGSSTTPDGTVTEGTKTGTVVCSTKVNVRDGAGVNYNLVGSVANGTKVTITQIKTVNGHDWGKIDTGWICLDYVTLDASSNTNNNTGNSGTTSGGTAIGTGIVTSNIQLNVREGAGMGYNKVGALNPGTEVTVYEQQLTGGMIWGRISTADGISGWACLSYITMTSTGETTGGGVMGTVVNTYTGVNVRSNPGTGSAIVGKIFVNSRVEIFEQKLHGTSYWGRTSQGWVCMDYILLDTELPPGTSMDDILNGNGGTAGGTTGGTTGSTGTTTVISSYKGTAKAAAEVYKEAGSAEVTGFSLAAGDAVTVYELKTVTKNEVVSSVTNADGSVSTTTKEITSYWARVDEGWVKDPASCIDLVAIEADFYCNTDNLNVRPGVGTASGDPLGKLQTGDNVVVTQLAILDGSIWGKVEASSDLEGWVNTKYLTAGKYTAPSTTPSVPSTPNAGTTTPNAPTTTPNTGNNATTNNANNGNGYLYTGTIKGTPAGTVNVRQTASTGGAFIRTLKEGDAVVIYELAVGDNMAWGRCDAGWVSLVYVDLVPYNSTAIDARVVQSQTVNVYTDTTSNNYVTSYAKCQVIDIYEVNGHWARTADGWVYTFGTFLT